MPWYTDYNPEFIRRSQNYDELVNDRDFMRQMWHYYKNNCVAFINDWCITYDPRNEPPKPKVMPFLLFPRQVDFVDFVLGCWKDKADGLCEKSRDMGITWLCCAISVWMWIFHRGTAVGWGSVLAHNIDDRGNPKSIFLKIRQIIKNLPWFFRPPGYNERWHAPSMKIIHPSETWGSTIVGEGGLNVGRGGRTSVYFKDESAHYEQPETIEASLSENTNVQIDISSVNGTANPFYKRRQAGVIWEAGKIMPKGKTRIFIFDWRENPLKSQEWYEMRRDKYESEGMAHVFAQEVDRNYNASIDRIIIPPDWVNAAVDAHKVLGFKPMGDKYAGQDVADGGGDKNALCIRHGVVLRHCDAWGGDAGEAANISLPQCSEWGVRFLEYDSIGVGVGFRTQINTLKERGAVPRYMIISGWNAGAKPLDPEDNIIPGDDKSPTNGDQYENLKAQSWFRMRTRFYKTWRAVVHKAQYDSGELISLDSEMPKLHQLKNELSQAQYKSSQQTGKTIVDKKPDGATSPNLADACIICYNPATSISIFDVL